MSTITEQTVADRLAELRPAILARVAEQLAATLPMVGVSSSDAHRPATHHVQMYTTAQRFHDMVQVATTADWGMARFEYGWTARVLAARGVSWEHQLRLIELYFAVAGGLGGWSAEELAALDRIAARLRETGATAYSQ